MRMDRGRIGFVVMAVVVAAVCVRLGFWQLSRLDERRVFNELIESRLARSPIDADAALRLAADSVEWRRVRLRGLYDYSREAVVRARLRNGVPGGEILTPLRPEDRGDRGSPAIAVLRGWLPARDGLRLALGETRPPEGAREETIDVAGIARLGVARRGPVVDPPMFDMAGARHPALTGVDLEGLGRTLPYPIAEFYVLAEAGDVTESALVPPELPALDEGSHRMYALQWFSFAFIAIAGSVFYVRRPR